MHGLLSDRFLRKFTNGDKDQVNQKKIDITQTREEYLGLTPLAADNVVKRDEDLDKAILSQEKVNPDEE